MLHGAINLCVYKSIFVYARLAITCDYTCLPLGYMYTYVYYMSIISMCNMACIKQGHILRIVERSCT